VVAPYEADAQLAFLSRSNLVDFIISEDSDLVIFGCSKIVFKLDAAGSGVLYEKGHLPLCLGPNAQAFSFDKFRHMCIMSGCDYLPSLRGVGLRKSFKFWQRVSDPDLRRVLPTIPSHLKMSQVTVTDEYVEGFIRADNTFLYQLVFDPRRRQLIPLNPYPKNQDLGNLSYAGEVIDDATCFQLCLGNLDLHTFETLHYFHPDKRDFSRTPRYGCRTYHQSIWNPSFQLENRSAEKNEPKKAETIIYKRRRNFAASKRGSSVWKRVKTDTSD